MTAIYLCKYSATGFTSFAKSGFEGAMFSGIDITTDV